tara:strand:- start:57001 stop:58935 length:1935 start_codon:yes stop_codon:yes gene_type:complete
MQFKYPELLYALFLLLIPILIHLFQLRRFQKVDFTNVAFLKKVTIQTRKSSQLKKWLTLLMRLLVLACIIFAFAQPFKASKTALNTEKETVLYLDNSFSMQAKGAQGALLQRAIQDIYDNSNGIDKISWFTNDKSRKNASLEDFKNELLQTTYSHDQLSVSEVLLKANQLFTKQPQTDKRLIFVSDFQQKESFSETNENFNINAVYLKPLNSNNISIDTAYVSSKNAGKTQLAVKVSKTGEVSQNIPISLYNNSTLIAKTALDWTNGDEATVTFEIENGNSFKGKLEINDQNLNFDNSLYFSINIPKKLKVLSINELNANYLQRMFDQPEFEYTQQTFSSLNYNDIPEQNFIVLNELKEIPASLETALLSFSKNGGSIFIIPSESIDIASYNRFSASLGLGNFSEKTTQEKKITQIVFDHPLYRDVFEKRVVNFQYPKVNSYYDILTNATSVLKYEDGKPFILQKNNVYLSTAAVNSENSNFQNSPLIVPTLFNMAQQSLALPKLYYTLGEQNTFAVPIALMQDEILAMRDSTDSTVSFIPLQQTKANKVIITTNEDPNSSGIYSIEKEGEFIEHVSFNYSREESILQYANPEDWPGINIYNSVEELFDSLAEANEINSFWKWFAIFALLFLIFEMLILKFLKN